MLFYFGTDLLDKLSEYYGRRFQQAISQDYQWPDSKYHWLYAELELRCKLLRQVQLFLDVLPQYIIHSGWETAVSYVMSYTHDWFKEKNFGTLPCNEVGHCVYFSSENPYWSDVQDVIAEADRETAASVLPLFHLTMIEYVVRCLRLYFYLREKQFKPIDRGKFDSLMSPRERLDSTA